MANFDTSHYDAAGAWLELEKKRVAELLQSQIDRQVAGISVARAADIYVESLVPFLEKPESVALLRRMVNNMTKACMPMPTLVPMKDEELPGLEVGNSFREILERKQKEQMETVEQQARATEIEAVMGALYNILNIDEMLVLVDGFTERFKPNDKREQAFLDVIIEMREEVYHRAKSARADTQLNKELSLE